MTVPLAGSYTEDQLIEQPAIALLHELGWGTLNAYQEMYGPFGTLGRDNRSEVVLRSRFIPAIKKLNPDLPSEAFDLAYEELVRDRSRLSLASANREIYALLKHGVRVQIRDPVGEGEKTEIVRLVDWGVPSNNDLLLVSQFWVAGEMYTKRADLVGFVNGIPLLFMELKASHKQLETAFTGNLKDYRNTIPHLFWYNALIILSNGSESRIGSITAEWGHFFEWKKINNEGEEGVISLETVLRGTCEPSRFLDFAENFILFLESRGGVIKLIGKNHQFLGVQNALGALEDILNRKGRLGVFWHTQGSGKSISMIFFSQKVLRKIPGDWTFVIVTDRQELDDQIYKTFVSAEAVIEKKAQAESSSHLRQLLREDHRYVFTLIQKFRTEDGRPHPVLSDRSDIIVITDEAHRSQYDTFALNMRNALPNASFIAFTGTPLIIGEEKTRQVFGEYVSIYDFKQSVDDGATVPLFYENRIPELQLTNENLNEDMERLLEEAELDEAQEKKLEREFAREYHLITRDDRVEKIAEDLVNHFTGRGFRGKAMVVSIDKATAVRMYDKVRKYWLSKIDTLKANLRKAAGPERQEMKDLLSFMETTDMAVVVSPSQNEIEDLQKKGADIIPHRRRMVKEDLDTKFKDPDDPFRIVFVCAMWMTGFDVPCCSTIYLDKPMRNHTLMQTIARANRVFRDKVNGLIVDYVGVFRNLQKALAIYGSGAGGGERPGESPVKAKAELLEMLKRAVAETALFCKKQSIDLDGIIKVKAFERIKLLDQAVDKILVSDDIKKRFINLAGVVNSVYKAILPDPQANVFTPICALFRAMVLKIESLQPGADITGIMKKVEELLDQSIATKGYFIRVPGATYGTPHRVDLSKIDFEKLRKVFTRERKRIEIEKLRSTISAALTRMVRLNKTRADYLERFQRMIDEYNAGAINIEEFFKKLIEFARELKDEEARSMREQLSEEELAVFDLIIKPDMKLSSKDEVLAKKVARDLLNILKKEKLVLDWRKRQANRAAVRVAIEEKLDQLPEIFTKEIFQKKCDAVYQHVFESYYGHGRSIYTAA
jgi:type I restriction enzyme R subunit